MSGPTTGFLTSHGHDMNATACHKSELRPIEKAACFLCSAVCYIAAEAIDAYRERTEAMRGDR